MASLKICWEFSNTYLDSNLRNITSAPVFDGLNSLHVSWLKMRTERFLDFYQVILPALEHTSGDVRDPASRIVLELYKKVLQTYLHFCSFAKETCRLKERLRIYKCFHFFF